MKYPLLAMGLLGFLGTTPVLCLSPPAHAANRSVEIGLQNVGDIAMFYQALLNTGVINQLNEAEHYTIFAPTNAAFARIAPDQYPCFYSVQCRPQIAALLRNHIIVGDYDLADLITYGSGIQSGGTRRLHVVEQYVNDYAVEKQKIISATEIDGNMIYRIDGVITSPQELAQFETTNVMPVADTVTTEKTTIVKKVYRTPTDLPQAYPAGSMDPSASVGVVPGTTQTTTVIHSYSNDPE